MWSSFSCCNFWQIWNNGEYKVFVGRDIPSICEESFLCHIGENTYQEIQSEKCLKSNKIVHHKTYCKRRDTH